MRPFAPLLFVSLFVSAPLAHADEVEAETPDQKALYTLGNRMARDLQTLGVTAEELAYLKAGMNDFFDGKVEDDPAALQNFQRFQRDRVQASLQREKDESAKFLAEAAGQKNAEKTDSGLVFVQVSAGSGSSPEADDTVKVTYKGTLRDGTVFDSQLDPARPATFRLDGVIPCWTEAIQRMTPGGKARFYCPADIAYGSQGAGANIRPGAALQFEVELLEVVEAE